jgi:hypothetical protein
MEHKSEKPLPGCWMERRHTSCRRPPQSPRGTLPLFTSPVHRCRTPTLAETKAGATTDCMNRLPSYDCQTSASEVRFFLGLGLAAMTMIAITGLDAARFSSRRQDIAAALSGQNSALASAPTNSATALTNLATLRPGPTEERSRLGPIAKPKS